MSSELNNIKISLRKDSYYNWSQKNPVLKNGEIAIVLDDNNIERVKVGNGLSAFNELKYLNETEFKSDKIYTGELRAKSISQGFNIKSTPTSLATGIFSQADGNFGVVHGIEARIKSGDDYAFVFNGENMPLSGQNFYESHGEGTFNINTPNGISGVYIGEQTLKDVIEQEGPKTIIRKWTMSD